MPNHFSLKPTNTGLEFENEAILEHFVWHNLADLFDFTPLQRQYCVQGQYCDILGTGEKGNLGIIELKNKEDRYIIQQLTRYYDALIAEKPFSDKVDYSLGIDLIAVVPKFHKDNLIDVKYHTLTFQLFEFEVLSRRNKHYFSLSDLTSDTNKQLQIPYIKTEGEVNIPSPPQKLLNFLSKSTQSADRERILALRDKILSFDERMQERVESSCLVYGKGKSKPCAEFRFDSRTQRICLFLWLPLNRERNRAGRVRIYTDWLKVDLIFHVAQGLSTRAKSLGTPEAYQRLIEYRKRKNKLSGLDSLVSFALETWLHRL